MTEETLLDRVVAGNKNYSYYDHEAVAGENPRKVAVPGDTIQVTARQAKAFSHRLVDPGVAEAQKHADEVAAAAQAEADQAAAAQTAVNPEASSADDDDEDTD